MQGTLRVQFAGTREEAREFLYNHKEATGKISLADRRQEKDECFPRLTFVFRTIAQREAGYKLLDKLGWDAEFVTETRYQPSPIEQM